MTSTLLPCSVSSRSRRKATFATLATLAVSIFAITGCDATTEDRRFSKGSSTSGSSIDPSVAEKVSSFVDDANTTTRAELYAPKGIMAEGQSFALSGSYVTDASELATSLGIPADNAITSTSVVTVVTAAKAANLKEPVTIVMDLPPQEPASLTNFFGLAAEKPNYVVVHTTYDAERDQWTQGVVPKEQTTIKDGKIQVQTTRMGRHEVVRTAKPLESYPPDRDIPPPDLKNAPIAITGVMPLVAADDQKVTLSGRYFTSKTLIKVGSFPVPNLQYVNPNTMTFTMPKVFFGRTVIQAISANKEKEAESFMVSRGDRTDKPFIDADASTVCDTIEYYNGSGKITKGTKACTAKNCSKNGEVDCVSTPEFLATRFGSVNAFKIRKGATIRGIHGLVDPGKPTPPDCSDARSRDCLTTSTFIPVDAKLMKAQNFRRGVSFPGIGLTGSFPNASHRLPGATSVLHLSQGNFGSALSNSSGIPFQYWDAYGNRHILTGDTNLKPENIREQINVYGVNGTAKEGELPPCVFNGDANCRARKFDYWAVSKSILKPENIRSGVRIGHIRGTYPTASVGLGSGDSSQLTVGNFEDMIKSNTPYTFYDSKGEKHTVKGSSLLTAEIIKEDVNIFGVTGTMKPLNEASLKASNIRAGATIEGVKGTAKVSCRNLGSSIHDTQGDNLRPTQNPWGTPHHSCTPENWVDERVGCRGSQHCVFQDKLTGLSWGGHPGRKKADFTRGTAFCNGESRIGGSFGGYNDWRYPTIQELMEAYNHGLGYFMVGSGYFIQPDTKGYVWSKTADGSNALALAIHTGTIISQRQGLELNFLCVRNTN